MEPLSEQKQKKSYQYKYTLIITIITALLSGYIIWYILTQSTYTEYEVNLPVYLYNTIHDIGSLHFPYTIPVTISGKRIHIHTYITNTKNAVHIDAQLIDHIKKKYTYFITSQDIFLPDELKLVHCSPVVIELDEKVYTHA